MADNRMTGAQRVLDANGNVLLDGVWCPARMLEILGTPKCGDWLGRTVLDIGGNTGGLSLELARRGAIVTLVEPDPLGRSLARSRKLLDEQVERESLHLNIVESDLFGCHKLPRHEIILFLGLVYHFRYPQYCLDYLSTLEPKELFVSSQTYESKALVLANRLNEGFMRPDQFPSSIPIAGFHPSHSMLRVMLEAAGFDELVMLTDREYCAPEKPFPDVTNSAYYRAQFKRRLDPEQEKKRFL